MRFIQSLQTCQHSGDCKREILLVSVSQRATMAGPEDPENSGKFMCPDGWVTCLKW